MTPLKAITSKVLSQIRFPVLARVDKSYVRKGEAGGYCFDGTIIRPGTLLDTGEIIKEVAINPIWAGKNGQGIYAPPDVGQIAIIGFIDGNSQWPYFGGLWGDGYSPSDGKEGSLVISDGAGLSLSMSGTGFFSLANEMVSLKSLLEAICDELMSLTVLDPISGTLPVSGASITSIAAAKSRIEGLFSS